MIYLYLELLSVFFFPDKEHERVLSFGSHLTSVMTPQTCHGIMKTDIMNM